MTDDESTEQLTQKLRDHWKESPHCSLADYARIARDHFAAKTPVMTDEKRAEAKKAFNEMMLNRTGKGERFPGEFEGFLVQWGLIPPAPVPTMGERFQHAYCAANRKSVVLLSKFFDEHVGPLIERLPSREREEFLAGLEAGLGGVKS